MMTQVSLPAANLPEALLDSVCAKMIVLKLVQTSCTMVYFVQALDEN